MTRPALATLATLVSCIAGGTLGLALIPASALAQPGAGAGAAEAADSRADLPIRQIILYRSGVGSFVRQAAVTGDRTIQLRFKTDQVNDILKSMMLADLDGGRIAGVSYASKEPLQRRLESFGVNINQVGSTVDLLKTIRGTPVRITTPNGEFEGEVLSVEERQTALSNRQGDGLTVTNQWYVAILTDTGVRSIMLNDITSFQITDEALAKELGLALGALAEHRADRVKTVEIQLTGAPGTNQRRVVVAYVHEMPVWKTSYRLVMPEGPQGTTQESPDQPMLQGWAVVENTTDEDWKDVRLSLASGRPVSFTMDLYEPLYAFRPDVPVPFLAGVAPRVYEGGTAGEPGGRPMASFGGDLDDRSAGREVEASKRMRGALSDAAPGAPAPPSSGAVSIGSVDLAAVTFGAYSPDAAASAGEIGEQFMYTIDAPVTIERQRSAMLPIINQPISGRRVSIFNAADGSPHPMRGVQLSNDSGLHLMPGPIAVYDGTAYAGDAQIPHTSRDQKTLLSYAVDLDVRAITTPASTQTILSVKIVDGLLEEKWKSVASNTYAFENLDKMRDRVIVVEQGKWGGEWKLVEPAKPSEETQTLYRFELPVKAGAKADLTVRLETESRSQYALNGYDIDRLLRFATDGKASKAVVDAVKKAAEMQSRINQIQQGMALLDQERGTIGQDQDRLRQNMNGIDRTSDLYKRYIDKLTQQETRLEEIERERRSAQTALQAAQNELSAFLRDLKVD